MLSNFRHDDVIRGEFLATTKTVHRENEGPF